VAEYRDRQAALVFHPRRWRADELGRLWDEWKNKATGEVMKSCTMLITEPNDVVAEVHDRMPNVLEAKDFTPWLNDGGPGLLKPAANDLLQR
jgi:putative SOS response-associated peptidase YedK